MRYGIMVLVSIFVRQFILPNPFACFGNSAFFINWFAEPFIHGVAYLLVGTIYKRSSCPALGSFLHLVFYAAITGILALMGKFYFVWWWILAVLVATILVGVLFIKLIVKVREAREWHD